MPYRRKYPTRAIRSKRRYATRRPRRRYAAKRRSYTKRPRTQKSILNLTSTKKQDTMLGYTNVTAADPAGGNTFLQGPAELLGNNTYIFPWICSARPALLNGQKGDTINAAMRTKTTCYMRGLKETISIVTNTGCPWLWRRIVFTMKGDDLYLLAGNNFTWWRATPANGVVRNIQNAYSETTVLNTLLDRMFDGSEHVDWSDVFNAKTDRKRINVMYDKTIPINSGNTQGTIRNYNRWHGMNKNLEYEDEEYGNVEVTSPFSTKANRGMGDCYVVDIFIGAGTASDKLRFSVESKLYWHEK